MKKLMTVITLVMSIGAHAETRENPLLFKYVDKAMTSAQRIEYIETNLLALASVICEKGIDGVQPVDVTMTVKDANGESSSRKTPCDTSR